MDADVGETEEHSENETDPTDSNEGQTQLTLIRAKERRLVAEVEAAERKARAEADASKAKDEVGERKARAEADKRRARAESLE